MTIGHDEFQIGYDMAMFLISWHFNAESCQSSRRDASEILYYLLKSLCANLYSK